MKYRSIPGIHTPISEVGFGVWSVATPWWGIEDEQLGKKLLRLAYEEFGITFFDTADVYGQGKGETFIADAIGDLRHHIVLATKFGYNIYAKRGDRHGGHSELPQRWDKESIQSACEESLQRLQTDYIDIYQLHNPRMEAICSDEVYEALERLKEEGKILCYGVALGPDIGWKEEGLQSIRGKRMQTAQIIHNLAEQDPGSELIAAATQQEFPLFSRVPHASGLLDGSYHLEHHFSKKDHRSHRPVEWMKSGVEAVADWEFLYQDTGRTIGQAAILFSLAHSVIKSVLPNITCFDNLREFAEAPLKLPLTDDEQRHIRQLWEEKHREALKQPFSDSITKPTPLDNDAVLSK